MWSVSSGSHQYTESSVSVHSEIKQNVILTRKPTTKPKPKIKPPKSLERIFGNKLTTRYFTAGSQINDNNRRDIHSEVSPFKYPDDLEEFSVRVLNKAWRDAAREKDKKLDYNNRHNYRTAEKVDLLNRLWVKEPEVKDMKTLLDMDSEFFSIVESRPVAKRLTHKEYIRDLREVLRTKITIGFKDDEVLVLQQQMDNEQRTIKQTKKELEKYMEIFESFLFNDHTVSMAILRRAEQEAEFSQEKYEIYKEVSKKYSFLKASMYNVEETWRHTKMYQKFLYMVSPMEWRRKYDFYDITMNDAVGNVQVEKVDSTSSIFSEFKLGNSTEAVSIINLIEQFMEDIQHRDKPELYFTEPVELITVFAFIEIQNLHSLLHSEELGIPLENIKNEMNRLNEKFDRDVADLTEAIGSLEEGIVWEEEREVYLEQLGLELINGDFKELISNDQAVNMYVFVEDVYETRIAQNDSNLSVSGMMQLIEAKFLELCLALDRLPSGLVRDAEMHCYTEHATMMKDARFAAKQLVQSERLMKNLVRLMEPRAYKQGRELKWRSAPKSKKKKPPPPPPPPMTEEECDHLTYFADFCVHSDDPNDFGIRVHKVKNDKMLMRKNVI